MTRLMLDAAVLPAMLPDVDVIAGYLPSPHASNPWPLEEWHRAMDCARELLPIFVAGPSWDSAADSASIVAHCHGLGVPHHAAVAIDVEQHDVSGAVASDYWPAVAARVAHAGFTPVLYTSRSSAHHFANSDYKLRWFGDWTNEPHTIPAVAGSVVVAVQYASPVSNPALHGYDLSIIFDDMLPLWRPDGTPEDTMPGYAIARSGGGYYLLDEDTGAVYAFDCVYHGGVNTLHPTPPAPYSIAVTATGKGYWISAADGGVFSFGDAPFRGSIPNNAKIEHVARLGVHERDALAEHELPHPTGALGVTEPEPEQPAPDDVAQ